MREFPTMTSILLEDLFWRKRRIDLLLQCAALKLALPKKVSDPSSSIYTNSLSSYWSGQEGSIEPTCVVSPTSSRDVAVAVSLLKVGGKLLPGKCNYAVRSGG